RAGEEPEVRAVKATLERVAVPVLLVGDAPVGGDPRHHIRGGAIERARPSGECIGRALLGGAVAADLRVHGFIPKQVAGDTGDVLGESAVDGRAGEWGDGGVAG